MTYGYRAVLDPFRMDEAGKAAMLEKLRGQCLRDGHTNFLDVLLEHPKVWGSAVIGFAVMIGWGFIFTSGWLFGAPVMAMWAAWWTYYLTRWPVSRRARATLTALDRPAPVTHLDCGAAVSLDNVSTSLRSLPRDLRETHRALWDSALAAFRVLELGKDDGALEVLESAEDRAAELAAAQQEMVDALEADKRALDFHSARSTLSSSALHAHEAAHADAEALLEGARSMREMTQALAVKRD